MFGQTKPSWKAARAPGEAAHASGKREDDGLEVLDPVAEEGEALLVLPNPGQHEPELGAHEPAAELVERDEDAEREVVVPAPSTIS